MKITQVKIIKILKNTLKGLACVFLGLVTLIVLYAFIFAEGFYFIGDMLGFRVYFDHTTEMTMEQLKIYSPDVYKARLEFYKKLEAEKEQKAIEAEEQARKTDEFKRLLREQQERDRERLEQMDRESKNR